MTNLLEPHDGNWREASGEEPDEIDLPDGDLATARTTDDIKAILFGQY